MASPMLHASNFSLHKGWAKALNPQHYLCDQCFGAELLLKTDKHCSQKESVSSFFFFFYCTGALNLWVSGSKKLSATFFVFLSVISLTLLIPSLGELSCLLLPLLATKRETERDSGRWGADTMREMHALVLVMHKNGLEKLCFVFFFSTFCQCHLMYEHNAFVTCVRDGSCIHPTCVLLSRCASTWTGGDDR